MDPTNCNAPSTTSLADLWRAVADTSKNSRDKDIKRDGKNLQAAMKRTANIVLEALQEMQLTPFNVLLQEETYQSLSTEAITVAAMLKTLTTDETSVLDNCFPTYDVMMDTVYKDLRTEHPVEACLAAKAFFAWLTSPETPLQRFMALLDGEGSFYVADEEPSAQTWLEAAEEVTRLKEFIKPEVYRVIDPELRCLLPHWAILAADYEPQAKRRKLATVFPRSCNSPPAEAVAKAEKISEDWANLRFSPLKGILKACAGRGKFYGGCTAIRIASTFTRIKSKSAEDFEAALIA